VVALVAAAPASASTVHVHNAHDHGNGSLRKALDDAGAGDKVKVPAGHYELSTGQLEIAASINVTGASARKTVIDANGDSRVLEVLDGSGTVKLTGLTIREGDTDATDDGGGILSGTATKLVLTRVAVLNNRAITNIDWRDGGGVFSEDEVLVKQSLFAGNHGYNGGAVGGGDPIKAVDSTFYNNFGGNPTFNGDGGAFDDEVELIDSTVVGNQCFNGDGCGGGLFGSSATLKGTIVANNTAYEDNGMPAGSPGNPGTNDNCANSAVTSNGHNLSDHGDCDLVGSGDIENEPARVGDLANNGGPTNTLALARASAAVNAGAAHCTQHDQRGVTRPQGPRCDIGAYERN
jgi:hypothetical protein